MSDTVKIIVITQQKQAVLSVPEDGRYNSGRKEVTHRAGRTLMSTLLKEKLIDGGFCGGRGDCGRCVVQFIGIAPLPKGIERSVLKPDELREGYRLACMATPRTDCTIRLALRSEEEIAVVTHVTPRIGVSDKNDHISQCTDAQLIKGQIIESQSISESEQISPCVMAVDLGTTTIAMQLIEVTSGRIVDTCARMNPQRRFGSDVLSRVRAAADGHARELKDCLWQVLEEGLKQFEETAQSHIDLISIAGNTTMEHLLMGLSTASLGKSPFTPVDIGLQKTRWKGIPVYVLPGISAFVGGDIVAGLYACGMLAVGIDSMNSQHMSNQDTDGQAVDSQDDVDDSVLFIDLGTNGELVWQKGDQMLAAATAAGPAFEGGAGSTVIGSDMIAIADALLTQGIMDETGLLKEPFFTEGISVRIIGEEGGRQPGVQELKRHRYIFTSGRDENSIYMTEEDIRSLQMAKAAVCTGVELLAEKVTGLKGLDCNENIRIYLAGGFGYYLDMDAAIRIGLLPKPMQGGVQAVGNTSLAGAYLLGRDLWLGRIEEEALYKALARIHGINLAKQEDFNNRYIDNLNFRK